MFKKTVEHYKEKFDKESSMINTENIEKKAEDFGIHGLKKELLNNSVEFKDFIVKFVNAYTKVNSVSYVAAITKIADFYNIPYKKYVGFCMKKDAPNYEENFTEYTKKKAEGIEHPMFVTHMYVTINDKDYENFEGVFDGIEHIDVVEI